MEAVVDRAGRIVPPISTSATRWACSPGTKADISLHGACVQVVPIGRTARLVEDDGVLVSAGEMPVDDDVLFGLIDGQVTIEVDAWDLGFFVCDRDLSASWEADPT
jgi:hypothetical protein